MELTVQITGGADSDEVELDRLTGQLRTQVHQLPVDSVTRVPGGPAPPGAKSVEAAAIGALLVTLTPAVLQSVVALVKTWAEHKQVTVKLTIDGDTIERKGAAPGGEDELLRLFLDKHAKG